MFLVAVVPAFSSRAETDVVLHAIVEAPRQLDLTVGSASFLKSTADTAGSAKAVIKAWDRLITKDNAKALEAFKLLSETGKFGTNFSYAVSSAASNVQTFFYAVDFKVPLSYFKVTEGTASLFMLIDGAAELGEALTQEEKNTQKIVLSALNAVLGGAKLASVITGFTLPGDTIVVTAAPIAVKYLMQYTPKVYKYHFNAFLAVDNLGDISEEQFRNASTYTYVQCHHDKTTYWGQFLDPNKEKSFLAPLTGDPNSRWKHQVSDFKLNGAWLSVKEKGHVGFATQKSMRSIFNACKLPVLIKRKEVKTGRLSELRKLFKRVPDSEITFEARDYGLVGKTYPVIFVAQKLKKS